MSVSEAGLHMSFLSPSVMGVRYVTVVMVEQCLDFGITALMKGLQN